MIDLASLFGAFVLCTTIILLPVLCSVRLTRRLGPIGDLAIGLGSILTVWHFAVFPMGLF